MDLEPILPGIEGQLRSMVILYIDLRHLISNAFQINDYGVTRIIVHDIVRMSIHGNEFYSTSRER